MRQFFARHIALLSLALAFGAGWSLPCLGAEEMPLCEVPLVTAPVSSPPVSERVEVGLELDSYYSNVNFYLPLTAEAVPNLCNQTEFDIYRYLLARSLSPRFIYLELSANPMPLLGLYLRSNHRHLYNQGIVSDDFNLIESITAGFREPYAFSIFFGSLANFVKPGATKISGKNRAYSGYLVSVGDHHIHHNQLVDDRWLELEWKVKGDRDFQQEKISWSLRAGGRIHQNSEIADTFYFGLRRSNLDYRPTDSPWRKNSSMTLMTEFNAESLEFQRQEIIIGKKFPFKNSSMAFSLEVGGIWQVEDRIYSGSLSNKLDERSNFIFVLRPNIVF